MLLWICSADTSTDCTQVRDFGLERKGGRESGEREGKKAEKGGGKKGEKRRGKIYKRDAKSCILELEKTTTRNMKGGVPNAELGILKEQVDK